MQIRSNYKSRSGEVLDAIYCESDPSAELDGKILGSVHAYCFCKDSLVIVKHPKHGWQPPGGGIDDGESYEEATVREVREETNMRVVRQKFIGFQDIYELDRIVRQTRSLCIVEPIGDFISDPDGEIAEIKLIDPKDYKKYFDWGEIGERVMERAMELRKSLLE